MSSKKKSAKRPARSPKLLSGGNPQIPKADGDAPVQDYIAAMPGWKRALGKQLDALIVRTVPDVRKAVRWNSPFYGVRDQGWFLSFHCFEKYLKVTFLRGASLQPVPPEDSKHVDVRYLHIHEDDPVETEQLASWILQASQLPGEDLFRLSDDAGSSPKRPRNSNVEASSKPELEGPARAGENPERGPRARQGVPGTDPRPTVWLPPSFLQRQAVQDPHSADREVDPEDPRR